jgi:hypothetical protein
MRFPAFFSPSEKIPEQYLEICDNPFVTDRGWLGGREWCSQVGIRTQGAAILIAK